MHCNSSSNVSFSYQQNKLHVLYQSCVLRTSSYDDKIPGAAFHHLCCIIYLYFINRTGTISNPTSTVPDLVPLNLQKWILKQ